MTLTETYNKNINFIDPIYSIFYFGKRNIFKTKEELDNFIIVNGEMSIKENKNMLERTFKIGNKKVVIFTEKLNEIKPIVNNFSIFKKSKLNDLDVYNIIIKNNNKINQVIKEKDNIIIDVYEYKNNFAFDYYYNEGLMKLRNKKLKKKKFKRLSTIG